MSLNETPMTRWYWREVLKKGTLIEEYVAVEGGQGRAEGKRYIDGVIICGQQSGDRKGTVADRKR
jgi:hypothetical protein